MTKTGSKKILIILSVSLFVIIALWGELFFLIREDKAELIALAQSRQQASVPAKDKIRLNKEKVAVIDRYFISSESSIKLLEDLEQLGQRVGVKLTIGQAGDSPSELKLSLSSEGTFSQVTKFLQTLESLPYGARVERLELKKGDKLWQSVFILKILKNNGNI